MIHNITKRFYAILLVVLMSATVPVTAFAASSCSHKWHKLMIYPPHYIYICSKCYETK